MKHVVSIKQLDRRFPTDEYGRPGMHLVQDQTEMGRWYDDIGLCQEERVFGHLFIASLPGDFSDKTVVGVFGGDYFTPLVNDTLTTIWWDGELARPFKEAAAYWALPEECRAVVDLSKLDL